MLITGATSGIGRALAVRLAGPGRELLLQGREASVLGEVATLVRDKGGWAATFTAELRDAGEVEALAEAVGRAPLTALVNNAGVAIVKAVRELTLKEWEESLAVNCTAPFLLCRALAARMKRGATIVNTLSVAARRGFPGWAAYCASKFALEGFSQCLREELREAGVRVVNVYPSATATGLWDQIAGNWPRERMLNPEEVAEAIAFVLERPTDVLVPEISIGHRAGEL